MRPIGTENRLLYYPFCVCARRIAVFILWKERLVVVQLIKYQRK
jgi:hypothetical protein